MDEYKTYESFCRICAMQSDKVENLFENNYNGIMLAEILTHCIKRPVSKTDCLPQSICLNCKTNLLSTYEFHRLCDQSEQYFLKRINKIGDEPLGHAIVNNHRKKINTEIKTEKNFDDIDFDVKCEDEPMLASELVCVEENFEINSDNIVDENSESFATIRQLRCNNPSSRLRKVKQNVATDKRFECFECKVCFSQVNKLRQHMAEHNITRKPFECTTCNIGFVHLNSWLRHRSRHTKNIHECEYCSQAFNTLTALKHHIQEIHKEHLGAYKCEQCSEKFALRFLLVCHKEWHKTAKQFKCSTCDTVFYNERKLKAHIRDNHASHLCAECGKSFKTIHLLASHQMLHTPEKPFTCNLCPSQFKWKAALKTHMLVHTGQKKHICDICGNSFTTRGSMKKHKRIHTGDRRYQCETCALRFYSNDHLKRHLRTHTGERPYICSYCPRSFSQSNDLTKHMRSHVGQNMYRCDCGESFRLQTELRKHSYTHYNKNDIDTKQESNNHVD